MPNSNYNLFDLTRILFKKKKVIIYIVLTVALITSIVTLFLPEYYKSTVVFYPYNLRNYDPRKIETPAEEIFGTREDCDRIFVIGRSYDLEGAVIKKFDLINRYEIDTTKKYVHTRVSEELESNLIISKDERGGIELTVYDKDPKFAAEMANETVRLIGETYISPVKEGNLKLLKILKSEVDTRYSELDSLSRTIHNLKKEFQYKNASAYFDDIKNQDLRVTNIVTDALHTKDKYMRALEFCNSDLPPLCIMEQARVSEKKAKPVRWLIVLTTSFAALILTCMGVILTEFYNNDNAQKQ